MGSLWVPTQARASLSGQLHEVRRSTGLLGEAKWAKVSDLKLSAYRNVVDFFFDEPDLRYRAIIVDQDRVDLAAYHNGNTERAYWIFYYELLEKWIRKGHDYNFCIDFKPISGEHTNRMSELRECLANYARSRGATVTGANPISSKKSHMAQICDVLTGAVAADANDDCSTGCAKRALADHVARRRGTSRSSTSTPSPEIQKFNVFRPNLRKRAQVLRMRHKITASFSGFCGLMV